MLYNHGLDNGRVNTGHSKSVKFDVRFRDSDGLGESVKLLGRFSDFHFEPLMR